MAFSLFNKRLPEPIAYAPEAKTPEPGPAEVTPTVEADSASEILELLELELGGMIRQLERAANSVASGAEATAATPARHVLPRPARSARAARGTARP